MRAVGASRSRDPRAGPFVSNQGMGASVPFFWAPGGRLSVTSGLSVTTADVTGATDLYYTEHTHADVPLFDGRKFVAVALPKRSTTSGSPREIRISLAALGSGEVRDVFLRWDGWAPAGFLGPAWTSITARAAAISRTLGRWTLSSDPKALYVGTVYGTGAGTCDVSASRVHIWNTHNRILRRLWCADSTTTWTYTTAAWQEARAQSTDGTSRVAIVTGLSEDLVVAINHNAATNSNPTVCAGGIGIDSSTTNSADFFGQTADSTIKISMARYTGYPGIGYHTIRRLEYSDNPGTATTWRGLQVADLHCGMEAEVMA